MRQCLWFDGSGGEEYRMVISLSRLGNVNLKENSMSKKMSVSSGFLFRLTESELLDKLLKETGEDSLKVLDAQLRSLDSGKVVLTLGCSV